MRDVCDVTRDDQPLDHTQKLEQTCGQTLYQMQTLITLGPSLKKLQISSKLIALAK